MPIEACAAPEKFVDNMYDCNDEETELGSNLEDLDCDGVATEDDCDDNDTSKPNNDFDCDDVATEDDCDDNDASKPNDDLDCDGVATEDDCDDNDT